MFSLKRKKRVNQLKFITYIVVSFAVILYQQFYPESADKFKMSVYSAVSPITNITRQPALFFENSLKGISFYFDAIDENKRLKAENNKLKSLHKQALLFIAENRDLRYLMNMAEYVDYQTVVANVFLDSSNLYANSFMINLGEKDGIKPGFAAISSEGLVGRVLEVNEDYSRVLLIDDYNASIPVRILETGVQGLIKGQNTSEYVTLITKEIGNVVKEGQHVVTSSVQGLFDDGLPVGIVTKVKGDEIRIAPYANLNRVHKVLIIKR